MGAQIARVAQMFADDEYDPVSSSNEALKNELFDAIEKFNQKVEEYRSALNKEHTKKRSRQNLQELCDGTKLSLDETDDFAKLKNFICVQVLKAYNDDHKIGNMKELHAVMEALTLGDAFDA